jgi:membrane associated rhomboid family serine protease
MIPLSDERDSPRVGLVTFAIIALCTWVFVVVQPSAGGHAFGTTSATARAYAFDAGYAVIPCEVLRDRPLTVNEFHNVFEARQQNTCSPHPSGATAMPHKHVYAAVVYSLFLHAGVVHLAGNMLFLWVFGANVEHRLGRLRYAGFYLAAGLLSALCYVLAEPSSAFPLIGASGAIAGVMGAYLVMYPNVRVRAWIIFGVYRVPAKWFLMAWFLLQFFFTRDDGVAWVAHVSGFIFGMAVGVWARRRNGSSRLPVRQSAAAAVRA